MRRILRALGVVALALIVVLAVGPYIVPLPESPDRDPAALATELGLTGHFAVIDGTRTFIAEEGPRDGPAVILIHGFGGSTFAWRGVLPALGELGYHAVALDLRNFGLADKSWDTDTSHGAQARFVLAAMDVLGIPRAAVVGHSMGADVAVQMAMAVPERVTGLVLVDAATGDGHGGAMAGPLAALAPALLALPPVRQLGRQVLRRVVTADRLVEILSSAYLDPAMVTVRVRAGYLAQIQTRDWDLALLAVVRDGGRSALPAPIASLSMPTLLIWGAADTWIPIANAATLRDAIPGSRLAIVDASGHLPFEEQPKAFLDDLLPFLATLKR